MPYTEDTLVQQTTAEYLANKAGFEVPQFSDSLQREIQPLLSGPSLSDWRP